MPTEIEEDTQPKASEEADTSNTQDNVDNSPEGNEAAEAAKDQGKKKDNQKNGFTHTVLVVEDSKLIRMMIINQLKSLGLNPHEAENGQEAIKKLSVIGANKVSLIMLDVMMPVMDGIEFMKEAKITFGESLPPVIVCTTNTNPKTIKAFGALGVKGYIAKPFKTTTLVEKISGVLNIDELNF